MARWVKGVQEMTNIVKKIGQSDAWLKMDRTNTNDNRDKRVVKVVVSRRDMNERKLETEIGQQRR
jgi:hypothetical protein